MNILIVDDETANLKVLQLLLEHNGHTVWCAQDGVEALETLDRQQIDAVISDILMPRMDGYRLCLQVRKTERYGDVPFMFYTSTYTLPSDESTAMKLGGDRFLKKPAEASEILDALEQMLQEAGRKKASAPGAGEELSLMQEYNARLVSKLEQRNLDLERSEAEIRNSREQLRALTARLQAAREEERLRISREIHDDLGELLTGFKLGLAWIRDKLQTEPRGDVQEQVLEKIATLGTLADTTTGRVRKLCTELRPSVLDDLGLVAAIEWQTREFQKRTNIRCELNLDEQQLVVSSDQGIALFRIYQEILTNVARHSQASKVRVLLRADAASLFLEVKDNGRGIQPAQVAGTGSLGLLGMRERAAVLGGKLDIHGEKARGTTIKVAIPVTRTAGTESPREAH